MAPPMASALRKTNGTKKRSVTFATGGDDDDDDDDISNLSSNKRARIDLKKNIDNNDHDDSNDQDKDESHYEIGTDSKLSLIQGVSDGGGENDSDQVPIEPFHMRNEREDGSGYFDGETYIFRRGKRSVGEEEDAWLDLLEEQQGQQCSVVRKNQDQSPMDEDESDQQVTQMNENQKVSVCRSLASLLSSNTQETVVQALSRYGAVHKQQNKKIKKQPAWKKQLLTKQGSDDPEKDSSSNQKVEQKNVSHDKSSTQFVKANIVQVSEMADALLVSGVHGIYDMTREDLIGMANKLIDRQESNEFKDQKKSYFNNQTLEKSTKEVDNKRSVFWEYQGNEDCQIHGPFTTEQMISWRSTGFFVGDQAVDIRVIANKNEGVAHPIIVQSDNEARNFVDDLMADLESDDEDNTVKGRKPSGTQIESTWLRSDTVNFSSYLN